VTRFVVRELHGYLGNTPRYSTPGLTVWVADEARNGAVVGLWRTEDTGGFRGRRDERLRVRAAELCKELNAKEEAYE
jgi:hypothetical protein